jgi:recombination protein RecR
MKANLPKGMGGGPSNQKDMLRQAQKMQEQLAVAQEELEQREFHASSGGGMVTVTVTGKKELTELTINPEIVDPEDVEMLSDVIMAAVNAALRTVEETTAREIGRKSAQRLAFHILSQPPERARAFADALLEASSTITRCEVCCNLANAKRCPVCESASRDGSIICVVADPRDVAAFERTREYNGLYHVLHGLISPMDGVGPEQLTIRPLLARLDGSVHEVVMATNPTVEGEATAMYLSRLIKPLGIRVTRLAYGIPMGGNLEYADDVTLCRAFEGRNEI